MQISSFVLFKKSFILATQCSLQDLSSPTRDWTLGPWQWKQSPNHWAAKEVHTVTFSTSVFEYRVPFSTKLFQNTFPGREEELLTECKVSVIYRVFDFVSCYSPGESWGQKFMGRLEDCFTGWPTRREVTLTSHKMTRKFLGISTWVLNMANNVGFFPLRIKYKKN